MDTSELRELQHRLAAAKSRLLTVRDLRARAIACAEKATKEARQLQQEIYSLTIQIGPAEMIAEVNAERAARGEEPLLFQHAPLL
ncbi:MAG: hypothetical protein WBC51_04970 [Vicinamibacterales bacterium]